MGAAIEALTRAAAALALLLAALPPVPTGAAVVRANEKTWAAALNSAPLLFVESADPQGGPARFLVRGGSRTIWLEPGAIWISLAPAEGRAAPDADRSARAAASQGVHLRLSFPGANAGVRAEPFGRLPTRVTTLHGPAGDGRGGEQTAWAAVRYAGLYPGIDLVVTGEGGHLRPRLVAGPGADLSQVRLRVEGAEALRLDAQAGEARLATAAGDFVLPLLTVVGPDGAPYSDLPAPALLGRDLILAPFAAGGGPAAPNLPEQADVFYATLLEGTSSAFSTSIGYGLAVEPNTGIAYVTGATTAATFPTTPGAYDTSHNGNFDVFVVQLSSLGTSLGFATFIGGSGDDLGYAIALGPLGFLYVTGETASDNFPTTTGAYDTSHNGGYDVFALKLNPAGDTLVYSTYVGGSAADTAWDIAVNAAQEAFVTGSSLSSNFPVTVGAYDTTHGGGRDAFILKLTPAGSGLTYNTFLGGSQFDEGIDIALAAGLSTSFAIVAGTTESANFPATAGAFDTGHNGGYDAFVARLTLDGAGLDLATFLGGTGHDEAFGLDIDGAGFLYVSGQTSSAGFPTTAGAYDRTLDGTSDSFAARLNYAGSALSYSTFLGGSGAEFKAYVAVDDVGMAYVTGETTSPDFPRTPGGTGNRNCGAVDAYAVRLSATGAALAFGITLGGNGNDYPVRAALDNSNAIVYYTGYTHSPNFPTTPGAYDTDGIGWTAAIAVRLDLPTAAANPVGPQGGTLDFGPARYEFGPGTFNTSTLIIHAPLPGNPTLAVCGGPGAAQTAARAGTTAAAGQALVGEPFDVTALYTATAEAAAPALPFTLTVQYSGGDLGGAPEDTLALHRWDGQQWVPEPSSAVDTAADRVSAVVAGLGTYAVLGESRVVYLPVVAR